MIFVKRQSLIAFMLVTLLVSAAAALGQTGSPGQVDFSLRSTNGQPVTSQSLHGKVVVLAFGASWLPLSRTQLQGVKKLADQYGERGVVIYWVSTESESNKAKNYAGDEQLLAFGKKYGQGVTILRDPDMVAARKLGVDELPSVVILDKQGAVFGEPIKGLDPDGNQISQLARQLEKLL